MSKKQGCISHSTPESETVALSHVLRVFGIPAILLWTAVLNRPVQLILREDNTACMQVITTGNNPTMRHLERVHNVAVKWIHELYSNNHFAVTRVDSNAQAADIFTKPFGPGEKAKWGSNLRLINMATDSTFWTQQPAEGGPSPFRKIPKAMSSHLMPPR